MNKLDNVIHKYSRRAISAQCDVDLAKKLFDERHRLLVSRKDKKVGEITFPFSFIAAQAFDLTKKECDSFAISARSVEGRAEMLHELRCGFNRHVRAELVNLYEAYELFLREIHAVIGYLDNSKWRCSDFGDKQLKELRGLPYSWFVEAARSRQSSLTLNSLLKRLSRGLPMLYRYEDNNWMKLNLRFIIYMCELFRHKVVHANGLLSSSEGAEVIGKNLGLNVKGKPGIPDDLKNILKIYLRFINSNSEVWLVSKTHLFANPDPQSTRPAQELFEILSSHAALIYTLSLRLVGEDPWWRRERAKHRSRGVPKR